MTSVPDSPQSLSPATRMAFLAAWGFVLAKGLVIAHLAMGPVDGWFLAAAASGFGADGLALLAAVGLASIAQRALGEGSRWARWLVPAAGVALGLYSLVNVFLVVEIGRPVTLDMLDVGATAGAAWGMLGTTGGVLTLTGLAVYLATVVPVTRWFERRAGSPSLRAVMVVAAYSVLAMAFVRARPAVASSYGLHRNAVLEFALSAIPENSWLAGIDPTMDPKRMTFPAPEGDEWTAPVGFDPTRRPKHLVLWLAESTGARYTSLFDEEGGATPNLARLKEHGLLFTHYYSNSNLSEKAIFGILCGMYPHPSASPMSVVNPRIACPSLMETLTSRGYRAGYFTGTAFGFGNKQKLLSERGFETLIDGENVPGRGRYWSDWWGIDDAAIVAEALRWLDARPDPDQPQLSVIVPIIPHTPYGLPPTAPRPFGDDTPRSRYLSGVHYDDTLFARLYDAYVERGLADDTLFVYVGDHGQAFEQHPGNVYHAGFVYEENVHVPLLLINPHLFPSALVSERLGSHVDLTPTLLDLLDQPIPAGGDGQSLVSDEYHYRPVFVGAFMRDRLGGLRDGDLKYIYNFDTSFEEVYDLSADPLETENIADRIDPERIRAWRTWVVTQQTLQKEFLEEHPTIGPTYMQRIKRGMTVALEYGDERVVCDVPRTLPYVGCPGAPPQVATKLGRELVRHGKRECVVVYPPPEGAMVVEFHAIDPPGFVGAGLLDTSALAGGTPLEVTWRIGAAEPIRMVADDRWNERYQAVRVPRMEGPVDVRVEVRSDDWFNRRGCLVLSP